jgi:hypothetical protein
LHCIEPRAIRTARRVLAGAQQYLTPVGLELAAMSPEDLIAYLTPPTRSILLDPLDDGPAGSDRGQRSARPFVVHRPPTPATPRQGDSRLRARAGRAALSDQLPVTQLQRRLFPG